MAGGLGRRPGRRRGLDAEQIIAAARAVGVATFTMPSVAKRLGVSHSTLYRYFTDRDDLARAVVDQIIAETPWPPPRDDWRTAVTDYATALWTAFDTNPGLADAAWQASTVPAAMRPVLGTLSAHIVAQGFTPYDTVLVLDFVSDLALSTFILMSHLDQPARPSPGAPSVRESFQQSLGSVDVIGAAMPEAIWHGRGWFTEKVTIFLDGFAHRRHPDPGGPARP